MEKNHIFFDPLTDFRIVPSSPVLPDITVSKYHLCGTITINHVPPGLPLLKHRDVVLTGGSFPNRCTTNAVGEYCFEAAPGLLCVCGRNICLSKNKQTPLHISNTGYIPHIHVCKHSHNTTPHHTGVYYITPTTTPEERAAGLLLQPHSLTVTINDAPKLNADFVQRLVSVGGHVSCLSPQCPSDSLVIHIAKSNSPTVTHSTVPPSGNGVFELSNITPGRYVVWAAHEGFCWKDERVEVCHTCWNFPSPFVLFSTNTNSDVNLPLNIVWDRLSD